MKPKVLLFNPESEFYAMPLGLLAVGSALDPGRFDVRIFDARIDPSAEARVLEEARDAVCVGLTVFSGPPIAGALGLSRALKARHPELPVVWGGWHPSILPEQCIESGVVDAVVIAQGEGAFQEFVEAAQDRGRWPSIAGLCIRQPEGVRRTAPRGLQRLETFPPARYDLLDVETYFRYKGKRQLDYSSSRGCPYKCTFCADPLVYGSKWTGMAASRVLEDLERLHARYAMDEVFFLDDDLFASLKRIQEMAQAFIAARIPFQWKGTARADELCRLPESFFAVLREAGCARINVGMESGSQQVLDRIRKEYRVDQILTAAHRAARAGIALSCSFITGFPGEQPSDFKATLNVLKAIRQESPDVEANVFFYSAYPGTELIRDLQSQGVQLPATVEGWMPFIAGSWDDRDNSRIKRHVRNVNFYMRHGYERPSASVPRRALRALSRFRCRRDWYGFGIERYAADVWSRRLGPV